MLPIVNVDIDDMVIVPCPKQGFDNKLAARHCPGCEHFFGVAQMREPQSNDTAWHEVYAIRCGHVIERRTSSID